MTIVERMQVASRTIGDRLNRRITSMPSEHFYANLPVLKDFIEVSRAENYHDLPADWHVAVADVEGSTAAVRQGRYKDVNTLGASAIMAVLNIARPLAIPFVFGGDGASLCIPESLVARTREALLATRRLAEREFGLKLRVGVVPVQFIESQGHKVRVARCRSSENYVQAAFTGGGVQFAERCIKDPAQGASFRLEDTNHEPRGDFSGLECRWDNIPSPHGEMVTLLVQATGESPIRNAQTYRDVLAAIERVYGSDQGSNPIAERSLRLTQDRGKLNAEARVRARRWFRGTYRLWMRVQSLVGQFLLDKGWRVAGVDWGRYKQDVIANTDFRKFDDLLRHILSGNAEQRQELTALLEEKYQRGDLAYGVHSAPTALMTCLIFQREGGHVHFVDGADGGYTTAADDLKRRLQTMPSAKSR